MPEGPLGGGGGGLLTLLQLTHQGEGAGSTQSIFSLSRELARRGHRVLVGCPAGTLLARTVAVSPPLEHIALDFSSLPGVANQLAGVIAAQHVDVVNSHATGDRRALTWLRWRGRLQQPFVVRRGERWPAASSPWRATPSAPRACTAKPSSGADCSQGRHSVRIRNMPAPQPAPLTVVIPTLNEASQIAECVRGLFWAREVIVVDAGSQDGTAEAAT